MLLSDICLSRTSGVTREQRPRKTKIGTEVAHITRDSDTTFKVKGQGHQAALLSAALTCKAAAAVSVGRPRGRRGAGHIVSPRTHLVSMDIYVCISYNKSVT